MNKKLITTRRVFIGGAASLPFLANTAKAEMKPGYLRFGLSAFPPNLKPWESTGASAGTVKMMLHRSLISYDRTGQLIPELAESWSLDSSGAWVFKLRTDAVFHNGEKVTADDVKWTIEQVADAHSTAAMRTQFQQVSSIETPDAHTVRLVTKSPQAMLPTWFANYNMFVIWRNSGANDPIGAGPFTLASQERGTSIDIAAFDRYYKPGLPKLKGISFIAYADENLRASALRSGDVDIIEYVPWQAMGAVAADPKLKLDSVDGAAFMDVLFNGSKPPFSDPRVRQAVAHAVKRDDIVQAAFFGRGKSLEGVPIIEGTPYFDEKLSHGWNYDPARSKALLAEAGFPNGLQTTLLATAQYSMHKDTAEVVQQYLAAVGIQCELKLPDWSTRVSMGTRGQYDIAIHGVAADNNDPDGLSVVMDTSLSPTHGRSFGLKAPRTTEAFARGRAEFDVAKRIQIYREMQIAALEEVPLVGLAWRSQGYGMDKRVVGFTNLPGALSTSSGAMLEDTSFG
jgi:peptide/nickel transport system substrate-binding protein